MLRRGGGVGVARGRVRVRVGRGGADDAAEVGDGAEHLDALEVGRDGEVLVALDVGAPRVEDPKSGFAKAAEHFF